MLRIEKYIKVADSLRIWVEAQGNIEDEACLFVNGAGANSSFWSDDLCNTLVEKGYYVIRYDHRDFGYSDPVDFDTHPYDVMDLAKDALAILDSLHIKKAHIIGHSMGGFIAQLLAIHYPERIISCTSVSSSTSSPDIPPPPEKTWKVFMKNNPTGHIEKDMKGFMEVWKYLNGTASFDEALAVEYTRNLYVRQEIKGALGSSHVKAQASLSDRSTHLKNVTLPALVIHGEDDYLVDKQGGIHTAECMVKARLVLIPHIPANPSFIRFAIHTPEIGFCRIQGSR